MKAFLKGMGIGLILGIVTLLLIGLYLYAGSSRAIRRAEADTTIDEPDFPETDDITEDLPEAVSEAITEDTTEAVSEDTTEDIATEDISETVPEDTSAARDVTLAFTGDVMFSEQYLSAYDSSGISAIADSSMLSLMQDADFLMINEEFPFSLRGEAMDDKQFTFRTDPKYVRIFQELGVDAVTVANNHALDFGTDAFCDTLDTLADADIACVGGGYDLSEASAPLVLTLGGQTFAIFAATRVSPSYSWYATDSQPGLFQTYDPTALNAAIADAGTRYDHTIVFVHWGIERNETPEDYQRSLAYGYIDAGADLVIGCHPHVLQGFEYYKGVPIIYSLGNYLFGNRTDATLLLRAVFSSDDLEIKLYPCQRVNGSLTSLSDTASLFRHLTDLSFDVTVSEDGTLSH